MNPNDVEIRSRWKDTQEGPVFEAVAVDSTTDRRLARATASAAQVGNRIHDQKLSGLRKMMEERCVDDCNSIVDALSNVSS